MNKYLLIVALWFFISPLTLNAQDAQYQSLYISVTTRDENGVWSNYSEWAEDKTDIWISERISVIKISSNNDEETTFYDILDKTEEITTSDGDKEMTYECMDDSDNDVIIKFMTRLSQDGRTEIYLTKGDKCTVYVIQLMEPEPVTVEEDTSDYEDDWLWW